jgi:hypothetical protein
VADPSKLDFSDWFALISASILAGISGAMGWFSRTKRIMDERISKVEVSMRSWDGKHAEHSRDLAVVQTCQENTEKQLEAIVITTRDTNENLKELSNTVTQVLLAIQAKKI